MRLTAAQLASVAGLTVHEAARQLGVGVNTYLKARRADVFQQTFPAGLEIWAQIEAA